MSKNSDYVSRMQAQMKQLDKELGALGAQGLPKARVKLQVASESAGAKTKAGMQATWETMRAALKKASSDPGK